MTQDRVPWSTYDFLSSRRGLLYSLVLALLAASLALFANTPIRADMRAMLPEGDGGVLADDFDQLSRSNMANSVFISLTAEGAGTREQLIQTADDMTRRLASPDLTFADPAEINPLKVMRFLLDNAPNLMNETDLRRVAERLSPESVKAGLDEALWTLNSPQGMVMKTIIRRDPFNLRSILAPRLKEFESLTKATVTDGHIFSPDGRSILLTAKSAIPLTDADGAARIMAMYTAAKQQLPPNIRADMVGGHVHTHVNAATIKQDLVTVSLVAALALTLLFVIFFRSRHAAGVFLAPLAAMGFGLGALALYAATVSAIVIGFGSVIIGISVDFSMHVYFAIARYHGNPGQAVQSIARPILFCLLTSCAAFGALLLSGMPGIRQLAVFSIAGLVGSAIFSLYVLPHLCRHAVLAGPRAVASRPGKSRSPKGVIIWVACMIACLWFGGGITLDPNLRSIEYEPESLRNSEARFKETWGDMQGKGVIYSQGSDLTETLAENEKIYHALRNGLPGIQAISLAPLIPSLPTQSAHRRLWTDFWNKERDTAMSRLALAGGKLGFSTKAFAPFSDFLDSRPNPVVPDSLDKASLGFLKDIFMPETEMRTMATYLPDTPEVQAFFSSERETELGVRFISSGRFKTLIEAAMKNDIKQFILLSGLAVGVLVLLLFRSLRRTAIALIPAITGIAAVFGVLAMIGVRLNLFHITALPLVIGLGADYGIFLVDREGQLQDLDTTTAVAVSGMTTLAGFGVLAIARHPSLHSLGITVLLGIGASLASALFLVPHLLRRQP